MGPARLPSTGGRLRTFGKRNPLPPHLFPLSQGSQGEEDHLAPLGREWAQEVRITIRAGLSQKEVGISD